jgi:hypothetical protein
MGHSLDTIPWDSLNVPGRLLGTNGMLLFFSPLPVCLASGLLAVMAATCNRALSAPHVGVGQRSKGHEDQLSEGFDTVCLVIWGYTFDDIDEDLLSVEDRRWYEEAEEADAVEFAEQHGYDLYIEEGTFCLLDDWDLFLAMILAKARGIPHPRECCGAEDQARGGALRREQEARRHQRPLSEISPASLDEKINDSAA